MHEETYQPGEQGQNRDEFDRDLNPDGLPGYNVHGVSRDATWNGPTAFDVKDAHAYLTGLGDDELKRIPVLPNGTRLEQGATYVNLRERERGEFTATADMRAESRDLLVPKSEVDYRLWNWITGVRDAERLGDVDDR